MHTSLRNALVSLGFFFLIFWPSYATLITLLSTDDVWSDETRDPTARESPYEYTPTRYVCIIFVSLFSVSTLVHAGQAIYHRLGFWPFPTIILGGVLEVAGWSGRLWSTYDVLNEDSFMLQIVATLLGPTPFLAANFIIFGYVVHILGDEHSRLRPRLYSIIFVTCDVIALAIQGVGGGMAAAGETLEESNRGGRVMLGGIVFQLAIITVFFAFSADFFRSFCKTTSRPGHMGFVTLEPGMKIFLVALTLNFSCLYGRAIYRTIELSQGWNGNVITNELWFNLFDGTTILLAFFSLNFGHPGRLLGREAMTMSHPKKTKDVEQLASASTSESTPQMTTQVGARLTS